MAKSLMKLAFRRSINVALTVVVGVVLVTAFAVYDASLHQRAFLTGWVLLAVMVFLALFNVRKKITMLPLGSASSWLQLHVYGGWLVIVIFGEHVGWSIPTGWLEVTLAALFVLVSGSGVVGIGLSRLLPPRLTRRGEDVIFMRIPTFVAELRGEAEVLVLEAAKETQSSTLTDFYMSQLTSFFDGPHNRLRHVVASRRAWFTLMNEIDNLERYLNPQEREYAERLRDLVNKKDELDFHYALNLALKVWLLVHVPATYSLFILAALHVVITYAFSGGI
jgi:hypothetical protein